MKNALLLLLLTATASTVCAKIDLSTLPSRDTVQLTIYNSADMTLVRESRPLTLKEGANKLQFSWANTLIDPTSLEMLPKAHAGEIEIADLTAIAISGAGMRFARLRSRFAIRGIYRLSSRLSETSVRRIGI